jgi:FAD/FMN-containing dehydrogenase
VVCKSDVFIGTNEQNRQWTNWNGDVPFSAEEYFEPAHSAEDSPPDGLSQLVHVVARATSEQKHLKAIGSGWAFEDIAKSDAWVVSLKQLTRRLDYVIGAMGVALTDEWRQRQLDPAGSRRLVHVEAGMEIGALNDMLEAEGLAMRALGGRNGQSLAGALSTSTHGGDWEEPRSLTSFGPFTW